MRSDGYQEPGASCRMIEKEGGGGEGENKTVVDGPSLADVSMDPLWRKKIECIAKMKTCELLRRSILKGSMFPESHVFCFRIDAAALVLFLHK